MRLLVRAKHGVERDCHSRLEQNAASLTPAQHQTNHLLPNGTLLCLCRSKPAISDLHASIAGHSALFKSLPCEKSKIPGSLHFCGLEELTNGVTPRRTYSLSQEIRFQLLGCSIFSHSDAGCVMCSQNERIYQPVMHCCQWVI